MDPAASPMGTDHRTKSSRLQKIGEGGYGRVFSDGTQALKVVRCGSPSQRQRFYWEYDCMNSMGADCPNILPVLGRHVDDGSHFAIIRMPLCQGSLAAYQKLVQDEAEARALQARVNSMYQKGLPEKLALELAWQMGLAVAECHSRGVVHADIKPSNFLLLTFPASPWADVAAGTLKLTDFGLAFHIEEAPSLAEPRGTRCYMAPEMQDWDPIEAQEQAEHRRRLSQDAGAVGSGGSRQATPREPLVPGLASDMFSLGVTLAELLTGAWVEDSADVTGPRWYAVSADTRKILRQLLATNPAERPSARAFLRMLQQHPLLRPQFLRGPLPGAGRIEKQLLALPRVAEKGQDPAQPAAAAAAAARLWQPVCRTVKGFWSHAAGKVVPEVSRMM